jgi:hypothetical protein
MTQLVGAFKPVRRRTSGIAVLASAYFLFSGCTTVTTPQPTYVVALSEKPFELRDYPPLVVAEVDVTGQRTDAANEGFRLLAGYIFGGNVGKASIAMTAPVTQAAEQAGAPSQVQGSRSSEQIAMTAPVLQSGDQGSWKVRFVMPEGSTLETMPQPNNPKVQLKGVAAERYATIRFSGDTSARAVEERTNALAGFVKARKLKTRGPYTLARYDPPWTLWFLRRNEIWVPVERSPE